MTFDKNSGLVIIWADLIKNGDYTLDDVPQMFNLREAVTEVMTAA